MRQLADEIVNQYRRATDDVDGLAELLVTYVEAGNQFTLDYGDIDESYYDTMEEAFQSAVDHLLAMRRKKKSISDFQERVRKVVLSTKDIGWGYHDSLFDIYWEAFGDPET